MKAIAALAAVWSLLPAAPATVRLQIDAPEKVFRPGQRAPLRFMIENAGTAEAKVDEPESYLEGLEITDPEGKVVKPVGKTQGIARRSVSLEGGGFLGRTVDVTPAFPAVAENQEGWYKLKWSFGDATSNEIRIFVMRDWIASLETNHGKIEIEFYPQLAPLHVLNFVRLARSGFYDGLLFHRVIPGFMMQGGRQTDSARQIKTPLQAEFTATKHIFGTVSMARGGNPNSATSEFFICFGAAPHLDGQYTVFGQVVSGEEVVKEVERVKSDHNPCKVCGKTTPRGGMTSCCGTHHEDRPEQDVIIKKVTLSERKK